MSNRVTIHVDGAVSGTEHAGAAAIARSQEGYFVGWLSRQLEPMSNNEAEYHAALLGLTLAHRLGARTVEIISDSEVVVRQMQGQSRVLSGRLKRLHQETCARLGHFEAVSFRHVTREQNHLADALAAEALAGRVVRMPQAARRFLGV
ncbi:MAG: ribonuclease HI family protein [Chloroflexi bacterium]|nr:ribonuclease HI family protein [Chloroflexota bacterium]